MRLDPIARDGAPAIGYPDFDAGFGRVDLSLVLPRPAAPQRALLVDDVHNDDARAMESGVPPGEPGFSVHRYELTVAPGADEPLRVTLAWSDPPGHGVQNDLRLYVHPPGETPAHPGNQEFAFRFAPLPGSAGVSDVTDRMNVVQHVRVPDPRPGRYVVRIWARNTVKPPQGFALAVSGPVSALKRLTV